MAKTVEQVLQEVAYHVGDSFDAGVGSVTSERVGGDTALHIVAKWGDEEAVRALVAAGAEIDKVGEDDNTPLHYAAMMGHAGVVKALIDLGASPARDRYGNAPSDLAVEHPEVHR